MADESKYLGYTPLEWQTFGEKGGLVGDGSLAGSALQGQVDSFNTSKGMTPYEQANISMQQKILDNKIAGDAPGWGMNSWGGTAVGLGNLGLGVLGYLEDKKTAETQRDLNKQQLANNKYIMAKSKENSAGLAAGWNKAITQPYSQQVGVA